MAITFLTVCGTVAVADLTNVLVTMVPGRDTTLDDAVAAADDVLLVVLLDAITVGRVDGIGLPSFVCNFST